MDAIITKLENELASLFPLLSIFFLFGSLLNEITYFGLFGINIIPFIGLEEAVMNFAIMIVLFLLLCLVFILILMISISIFIPIMVLYNATIINNIGVYFYNRFFRYLKKNDDFKTYYEEVWGIKKIWTWGKKMAPKGTLKMFVAFFKPISRILVLSGKDYLAEIKNSIRSKFGLNTKQDLRENRKKVFIKIQKYSSEVLLVATLFLFFNFLFFSDYHLDNSPPFNLRVNYLFVSIVLLLLLFLNYSIYKSASVNFKNFKSLTILITLFFNCSAMLIGWGRYSYKTQYKANNQVEIELATGKNIKTGKDLIYVGETHDFAFLYDKLDTTPTIIHLEHVVQIKKKTE